MNKTPLQDQEHICCICGKKFKGWGNNPYPVKQEGVCCDNCNWKVIEARLNAIYKKEPNNVE
jgi:DNA-directed RNA polymerase subunit RPC12/RpoP